MGEGERETEREKGREVRKQGSNIFKLSFTKCFFIQQLTSQLQQRAEEDDGEREMKMDAEAEKEQQAR